MEKLIKLSGTHYVICDDSEIKKDDWCLDINSNKPFKCLRNQKDGIYEWYKNASWVRLHKNCKKLTHSTQPELLGEGWMQSVKPLLLSEVEEVINGYSVEKMADNWFYNEENKNHYKNYNEKPAWIKGFKAHQKLTKDKLFTAQPLEHLLNLLTYDDLDEEEKIDVCEEYIRNLLIPKTEWNVKFNEQGKLELI